MPALSYVPEIPECSKGRELQATGILSFVVFLLVGLGSEAEQAIEAVTIRLS